MKKYEIVLMIDPAIKDTERNDFIKEITDKFSGQLIDRDDIGIQKLKYDLARVRGKNTAYFYSLFMELNPTQMQELKQSLLYNKILFRYAVFVMDANQEILKFQATNEYLQGLIDSWQDNKFGQKVTFLTRPENHKYIVRKALPILKKYTTRFGDIKPRKYTNNTISVQKKLKKAIVRARELGLVDYIKQ
jgi:ribosomal protein S18/ribosomal protein S6